MAPIIVLAYFIDVFISTNLKQCHNVAYGENSTWNDLFSGSIDSDVVVYGSSRAWVHISPEIITKRTAASAYNLGIDGHNFWLQYLRHKLLLEKSKKPKLIIFSVDVFTLEKRKDLYNSEQFLPYMLWNSAVEEATLSYNGFHQLDYKIPLLRYYGKYNEIVKACYFFINPKSNQDRRVKGYQGQDKSWNNDLSKAQHLMKKYAISLDPNTVALFDKFLKQMQQEGVKIVLVYTPEYIEGQYFVENRAAVLSLYAEFGKRYNIPFYDFSDDTISYDKTLFYNSSHLNRTGAELFSHKLVDTLQKNHLLN